MKSEYTIDGLRSRLKSLTKEQLKSVVEYMQNMLKDINKLTPKIITQFIKDNPGCIQSISYPNPGEPQLDESFYCGQDDWSIYCCNCDTHDKILEYCCDNPEKMWLFQSSYSGDISKFKSENEIGECLKCIVEDSKIIFKTD